MKTILPDLFYTFLASSQVVRHPVGRRIAVDVAILPAEQSYVVIEANGPFEFVNSLYEVDLGDFVPNWSK